MSTSGLYGSAGQASSSSNTTSLYGSDQTPAPDSNGNVVIRGTLTVNGCAILSNCNTFALLNEGPSTINFGGNASNVNIGKENGTVTIAGDTLNIADIALSYDSGTSRLVLDRGITATGGTFGNVSIAPGAFDNTITTTTGDLYLASATKSIGLQQNAVISYSENNDRLNRPTVISTTGNTSGWRVQAPNATTNAVATVSVFNSNDDLNGTYMNIQSRGGSTDPLRISTGKYILGTAYASGESVAFRDGSNAAHATVNPAGPTIATDLTTKAYVDAHESDTTYTINASSTTGGANFNLVGSDATTDTIKFGGSGATTVTRTSASEVTIASTNTTYTQNASSATGGANLNLVGSDSTTDTIKLAGSGATTVTRTSDSEVTIASTNTTYTQNASATTGGANLNLVGSDATTDTITFAGSGATTVTRTDANTITIDTTAADPTKLVNGVYEFVLNADGTVTTPSSIAAPGAFTLQGGATDPTTVVIDDTSVVTTLDQTMPGGDSAVLTVTNGFLQFAHTAGAMVVGSEDGTWTLNPNGTTSFPNYTFPYADGTTDQVLKTDGSGNLSWYSPSDLNTTYTMDVSATTGGANLNLVGSDSSTDTIKFANGTGITAAETDANTITITNTGVITVNGQSGTAVLDTDDVGEGSTNLYFTTARARQSISATGDISYDNTTGVISYSAPSAPVVSVNGQTGAVVLDTDDVAEGSTNLYYTDSRARAALSAGTGITYDSGTGVIATSITQYTDADARAAVSNGVDLYNGGAGDVYVKSLRDTTRVKGSLEMTRDDAYVFPPTTNNWTVGNNGFDIASSGDGWIGSASTSLFLRDTFAYTSAGTGFAMRTADGTSATTGTNPWFGTPNTGPLQTPADALMGTINWNAYATGTPGDDWTNNFSTNSMGGGIRVNHALQLQGYTTEAPTTTTVTVTPLSQNARFTATIPGVNVLTTKGVFSYTGTAPSPGQVIRVFGAPTGTGGIVGYVSGTQYYCVARDTTAMTFTISATKNGLPIDTIVGTVGMTFQRCGYAVNIAATDPIPYTNGSIVRVSGFGSQIPDGEYTVYQATNTVIGIGVYTTANPTITGSTKYEADTVVGGAGFRIRGFADGTIWNNNTRTNFIDHKLSGATYTADSFTFTDASGAALPGGDISYSRSTLAVHNHSTISPAAVNTIYDMEFDETPYISENISLVSNKQITFAVAGRYKIRFTGQAYNSGSNPSTTYVWLAKNGNGTGDQVDDSAFDITILKSSGSGDSKQLVGMEWIVEAAANDYYIIQFASDSTSVSLVAEAASGSPYTRPAVPSAQLKVEPVGA